jgi:RND family efflux transporter MFP subunit
MKPKLSVFSQIIRVLLPVCILAAGFWGYHYFKSRETKVKRRPPVQTAMLVETIRPEPGDFSGTIRVMGTVVPDRQVSLKSRVAGEIIDVSASFVRGGVVNKGEVLVRLDDSDYAIAVKKADSALAKARADLEIEQGSQTIAEEEFKLISKVSKTQVKATDLALRKPQLAQAKASVLNAQADLETAHLNLARTVIRAPFNSLVLEKKVDQGSLVSAQETIAVLVDIDAFHVEALVPPDQLGAVSTDPENPSPAVIRSPFSHLTWPGKVVRATGKMSQASRMAGILVEVSNPLGQGSDTRPLLLDDHVIVDISGTRFENVFRLPRNLLRDRDTVWINTNGQLEIRKVTVAWKQDGTVFISNGLTPEDDVIVTDLSAPISGMALQNGKGNSQ